MTPEPPSFSIGEAAEIFQKFYGLEGTIRALPAYYDLNFEISPVSGSRKVLKIANIEENSAALEFQHHAMAHLAGASLPFDIPRVVPTLKGETVVTAASRGGTTHFVRLLTFIEGHLWADLTAPTPEQLRGLGRAAARLVDGFRDFSNPTMHRRLSWDPTQFGSIRGQLEHLSDHHRREKVENILRRFENFVEPRFASLSMGVIHSDVNQHNVIVDDGGEVKGIIDFGDVVHSVTIGEVAITMAYALLGSRDPVAAGAQVLMGYRSVLELEEPELDVIYDLILERLAMSATSAARLRKLDPDNAYAFVNEAPAWELIEYLVDVGPERVRQAWGRGENTERPNAA